jgi:hypothetical protein
LDIQLSVERFMAGRAPCSRASSFDYCFNYFQQAHEDGALLDLCSSERLETSSLQLGFYLASWGMFRGKAQLLRHSSRFYEPLLNAIATADDAIWSIDLWDYDDATTRMIVSESDRIRDALFPKASQTLVTKVMLGVYGCTPAFDSYFRRAFGRSFSYKSLLLLHDQFREHRDLVESCRPYTLDFATGGCSERKYTAAKIVDMHYFIAGGGPSLST